MRELALEDVARLPRPGTARPSSFSFSPSGSLLTYLHGEPGSLSKQLHAIDVGSGESRLLLEASGGGISEENLSLDEKLRRERARELGLGVTSYAWAAEADVLAVPQPDGVHVWRDGDVHLAVSSEEGAILDPRLSPDGSMLAFVRDAELFVVATEGSGAPLQVSDGARGTGRTNGLAEFIAQEEMDRYEGYWWSCDGRTLAYQEVDETHIPVYRIVHQGSDDVGTGAEEDHRYPFAGAENARVRLFVAGVDPGAGAPIELDLGDCEYLARVQWLPDGSLVAQLENRGQDRLDLVQFDPETGERTVLLTETSDTWINLHNLFRPLRDGRFLWASEGSGYQHLELRSAKGDLERELTSGEWMVTSVDGVDEDRELVWFTATEAGPLERHFYEVSLAGGAPPRRLTTEPGVHEVVTSPKKRLFVDAWSDSTVPAQVAVRSLDDGTLRYPVVFAPDPFVEELELEPPEIHNVTTRDGATLYAAVYRPAGEGPHPTVLSVYGGPHAQLVTNSWMVTTNMRAQYLRQRGFLVVMCDNRGQAYRGKEFETAIARNMGDVEVRDQVDVVRQFAAQGLADAERVGIYGWSYGGYLAAMCLARAPETFHVAVAGAPVTAWDGYDTYYTERYMGTPQDNPAGYESGRVMHHAASIEGRLLLVHGLIDENVHFRHTARLINALIRHRKRYELLLFPNERHSPRSEVDRVYMEERIFEVLAEELA